MRIFVSEAVCGGGWPGEAPVDSLRREGAAMLTAVARDFARLESCHVVTTWDARLGPFPAPGIDVVLVASAEEEREAFARESARADATLVIAPEFHDMLAARTEAAIAAGGRVLGPSPEVIRLCGDKLALARRLAEVDPLLPIIPTFPLSRRAGTDGAADTVDAGDSVPPLPLVVKPRHGAGSVNTFLIRDRDELRRTLASAFDPPDLPPDIVQPYVAGRALSVAGFFASDDRCALLPVAEQNLTEDGRFHYLGGRAPATDVDPRPIHDLARRAARHLGTGLRGYVGFDILLPDDDPSRPVLVEINPRLTTSYLVYQAIHQGNLAAHFFSQGSGVQISESAAGSLCILHGTESANFGI